MRFLRNFYLVKGYPLACIADIGVRKGSCSSEKVPFSALRLSQKQTDFSRKMDCLFPVRENVVSESYAYPLGYFSALRKPKGKENARNLYIQSVSSYIATILCVFYRKRRSKIGIDDVTLVVKMSPVKLHFSKISQHNCNFV